MKKGLKTVSLSLAILASTGVLAGAVVSNTVTGEGAGTGFSGYVEGDRNSSSCYGATTTIKKYGPDNVRAYVEIVNADGFVIGSGAVGTSSTKAYSGTVSQAGGRNAYGSVGTASRSASIFVRLY